MTELAMRLPLAELLRRQDQLVRREQALAAGLNRTVVDGHLRQGRWCRVLPSVYLTEHEATGAEPRLLLRRRIRATWMWAGDNAVITGAAAAVWAQYLDSFSETTPIGVIIPPSRRMSPSLGLTSYVRISIGEISPATPESRSPVHTGAPSI